MSGPVLQRVSVFEWDGVALNEIREGALARARPHGGLIVERVRASERVRSAVGRVLRWLGAVLLVSPLLIVPKLLIPSSARWISDAITVGFVCVVVLFFATLNLFFVVSLVWWMRRGATGSRFATPEEVRGRTVTPEGANAGARVSVEGVVVPIFPAEVVLRRADLRDTALRFVIEASTFAVVPNEGTPVIVSRTAIPVFDGSGDEDGVSRALSSTALALARPDEALRAERWELRAGERVSIEGVVSRVVENADRFDIDGEPASLPREGQADAPYRRGPGGVALIVGDDSVVVVSKR